MLNLAFCRSLGVHISKVRSIQLDAWEPELLKVTYFFFLFWLVVCSFLVFEINAAKFLQFTILILLYILTFAGRDLF